MHRWLQGHHISIAFNNALTCYVLEIFLGQNTLRWIKLLFFVVVLNKGKLREVQNFM